MRRGTLIFAAGLLSLSALMPVTALASTKLTEYVVGAEYAVGTCPGGGDSGSFAGVGSATKGGSPNALFNTTICHTALTSQGQATILPGGGFQLATSKRRLVGQYAGGTVGPGVITPLGYFCKEEFPVVASLGPISPPPGATSIREGTAVGMLTHVGVLTPGGCRAFAASIAGVATLVY